MRHVLIAGGILCLLVLGGCQDHQTQLNSDVARLKQENQDLKARVAALEGRVEALAASLPDADLPSDDKDNPTGQ